uniref:Secreted protein n=1 Tax=Bursaphelenchus xylophilus TaxID=6326 RepID=A0A1I7SD43_BURXY
MFIVTLCVCNDEDLCDEEPPVTAPPEDEEPPVTVPPEEEKPTDNPEDICKDQHIRCKDHQHVCGIDVS